MALIVFNFKPQDLGNVFLIIASAWVVVQEDVS